MKRSKANGLTVTVDKNDTVLAVAREADQPRWRFQRLQPRRRKTDGYILSEEAEQEVLALYVDHPEISVGNIKLKYGLTNGFLGRLLAVYNVPLRNPKMGKPRVTPTPAPLVEVEPPEQLPIEVDLPHVIRKAESIYGWRVTVTRTVVETIGVETLLDVAAHYDGSDAKIIKVERIEHAT